MKHSGDFSIGGDVWAGSSKLIEEMGELQQVLGKLIGSHGETAHYDGTELRQRLLEEIADLTAAINFFEETNLTFDEEIAIANRRISKLHMFRKWHKEGK